MFCEYSGDFYDVWENFGEKGILVISEKFYVFRVLRVFRIPKCCQDLELKSGLENRNFQQGFWCLEGVLGKVVFCRISDPKIFPESSIVS